MERGDTGLGRDAYGIPRRERDRRGYGPGPYPSDDGYPASAEEDDAAGSGRPVDAEEDDYGQLLRRPGEMPPRQRRLRQPGRPRPGQPGRFPPGAVPRAPSPRAPSPQAPLRRTASLATAACPVTACPTVRRRVDLRAPAGRTAGTQMAACPTGRCRTAAPRTAVCRMAPLPKAPLRTELRTGGSRMAVLCLTAGHPTAGRYPTVSTGCRTGVGCHRTRTACTGHRGLARRAGQRAAITGRVRLSTTRTPTAGAARRRHRAHRRQARHCQAARGLEHRPLVRLTGVRSPIAPREYPGYLGNLGYLGLRRCGSTRPRGRASMVLTAASGSGHQWAHRRGHRWRHHRWRHHRNRRDR